MVTIDATPFSGEQLARRILFLAFNAAVVSGMGFLQNRGTPQTEGQVWKSMAGADDYGNSSIMRPKSGEVIADYVQGRMMKLYFDYAENSVELRDSDCEHDYQSWCGTYPSYQALANAALGSLRAQPVTK